MSGDIMLERVRMCLAEAGYDPQAAEPSPIYSGGVSIRRDVPDFVAWRSAVLAGFGFVCWPCARAQISANPDVAGIERCDHTVDPFCAEDAEVAW